MADIYVLDCTLRDGGYCNGWRFGFENIGKILQSLQQAGADVVECGFLTNKVEYDSDCTRFTDLSQISPLIPDDRQGTLYVCMINYGEYDIENLPPCDHTSVDGIRVAFHKKDIAPALELCRQVKAKGYKLFVQPMVSLNYTDEEFLSLINQCNSIEPYGFYIVDSFGVMKRRDLIRLFYLVEHNLSLNVRIGYHAHNNMQLAYANAQALVDIKTNHDLIIDCSIFGMGRGAGNLNTELFVEYLNDNIQSDYRLRPLLEVIDSILDKFYQKNRWGYSLSNYLSASHNIHPNYASYLSEKQTLTMENINEIFSIMEESKKVSFDKAYIEELYAKYMETGHADEKELNRLKQKLAGKKVLIIAPGKSIYTQLERVEDFAKREDTVVFSINFDFEKVPVDFIFLSNLRRFREMPSEKLKKCIVTSNIPTEEMYLKTGYKKLMNDVEGVRDNAGLMLMRYLILLGVREIYLAGLDGYSTDTEENYYDRRMSYCASSKVFSRLNTGMREVLSKMSGEVEISFVTEPVHIKI